MGRLKAPHPPSLSPIPSCLGLPRLLDSDPSFSWNSVNNISCGTASLWCVLCGVRRFSAEPDVAGYEVQAMTY